MAVPVFLAQPSTTLQLLLMTRAGREFFQLACGWPAFTYGCGAMSSGKP
jgi:hypothetical protein